jgi:hypothetical protein
MRRVGPGCPLTRENRFLQALDHSEHIAAAQLKVAGIEMAVPAY